jgi:hypothetical protein
MWLDLAQCRVQLLVFVFAMMNLVVLLPPIAVEGICIPAVPRDKVEWKFRPLMGGVGAECFLNTGAS